MNRRFWSVLIILAMALAYVDVPMVSATSASVSNQLGQNGIVYSEQFDNLASWIKQTGVTVTPNVTAAPDGTMTADLIDFTAASASTGIYNVGANAAMGYQNTKSVWLKGVLGTETVQIVDPQLTVGSATCTLTLSWQRCFLTEKAGTQTGGGGLWIRKVSGNQFYAWGAQFNRGKIAAYNKTIASQFNVNFVPVGVRTSSQLGQNYALYSEQFDNSVWTKSGSTVIADQGRAPDGTMTMDLIYPPVTSQSGVFRLLTGLIPGIYTYSVYLKSSPKPYGMLIKYDGSGFAAWFNLSNGTVGTVASGYSAKIVPVGDGIYRCSVTNNNAGTTAYVAAYPGDANNQVSVVANGTDGILAWGAQLVRGTSAGAYNRTTGSSFHSTYAPAGASASSQIGQNLLTYSEQFISGNWLGSNLSITPSSNIDPAGGRSAWTLTRTGINSRVVSSLSLSQVRTGMTITLSAWARAVSSTTALAQMRDNTIGPVGSQFTITDTWKRYSATWVAQSNAPTIALFQDMDNALATLEIFGAQLVIGQKPGAYNKTTATAVNSTYRP